MARRGNNEGSIFKRKDGRWEARITYYESGRPKRKSIYGKTRAAVSARLHENLADNQNGFMSDPKGYTVGSYLHEWLEIKKRTIAETTANAYANDIAKFGPLHHRPLDQITAFDIEKLYIRLLDSGLSTSTVRAAHSRLYSALKDAVRYQLITRNVMEQVRPPKLVRDEAEVWKPHEIVRLLEFAKSHRLYSLIYLAICTGMRRGELIGLHWTDVEWSASRLHVKRSVVSPNGTLIVKEPKSPASRRAIYVDDEVLSVLRDHRAKQQREATALADGWPDKDIVFTSEVGAYLDPNNLNRTFGRIVGEAEIRSGNLHKLRHTHASMLIRKGVDPKVVSDRLGHSSVAFTQTIYQHLYEDQRSGAAFGLNDLLS